MRSPNLSWLCLLGTSSVVLGHLLLPGMVMAQEMVMVQLEPVGESGVSGTASPMKGSATLTEEEENE